MASHQSIVSSRMGGSQTHQSEVTQDPMSDKLHRFQNLLRKLFQSDWADLDFGIYRILNYKRQQVEDFINERMPQIVDEAFDSYAASDRGVVENELEQIRTQISRDLGNEAITESGEIEPAFRNTPLGRRYVETLVKLDNVQVADDLQARVYNDLHTFFSRYYEDGDFISKRRYRNAGNETYAVPYNGEEVLLHWANKDQYYVKTGDRFASYRFKTENFSIAFALRETLGENDTDRQKRYFVLCRDNPQHRDGQEITIYFQHRTLSDSEEQEFGRTEQQRPQANLNYTTEQAILKTIESPEFAAELAKPYGVNGTSLLLKHLNRFTHKNSADFFVHKDLRGFLTRELDFFLKNEVLLLDEAIGGTEDNYREHLQLARVERSIAEKVIDFLTQVENFQKMLWEKRKFVTETNYCITVGNIQENFYAEIASCAAQWDEWKELFHIDEDKTDLLRSGQNQQDCRIGYLRSHPTLVLDTKHFGLDFVDRLLASFHDIGSMTDGVLIHGENFQALNMLVETYRDDLKCVYIDPPFNTAASEILYKNDYKHSTWLSFMSDRLAIARQMVNSEGTFCVAIDDSEYHRLYSTLLTLFGEGSILGTTVIRSNPAGRSNLTGFSVSHEYAIFVTNGRNASIGSLPRQQNQIARYKEHDDKGAFEWVNFRKHGGYNANRIARPRLFYPIYVTTEGDVRIPSLSWDNEHGKWQTLEVSREGEAVVYPINQRGEEKTWKWGHETAIKKLSDLYARPDGTSELGVYMKSRMSEGTLPSTLWVDKKYSATDYGTNLLAHILGRSNAFPFPKSVHTVSDCLRVCQLHDGDYSIDFFAGSGTTAHSVISMNRSDGENRKFLLVEMGNHFCDVLLPRIKKIIFTPEWKEGKPKRMATEQEAERSPRIVKYCYIESYEDSLRNIEFTRQSDGQAVLDLFGDEYLLKYMLNFETQDSPCLLNMDMFQNPFDYKLKVQQGDEIVEQNVDLVETFNFLLGLQVSKRRSFDDGGRLYLGILAEREGKRVLIVWRSVIGLDHDPKSLSQDRKFIEETMMPALLGESKPERLFVNGSCFVENAEAIEPEFKKLMFSAVN